MPEKVVILSPTELEINEFHAPPHVKVEVCGVGQAEVAAGVVAALAKHRPALIILAGIAGAYEGSGLAIGEVVLVGSERVADLGAMRGGDFVPLYNKEYACPFAGPDRGLPRVASNTLDTAAFASAAQAAIENMEGAAFFATCLAAGVPFLELRAISNRVGDARSMWDIPLAVKQLHIALNRLLHDLEA